MKSVTIDPRVEKSEMWRSKLRDFEAQLNDTLGQFANDVDAEWTLSDMNGADVLQLRLRDWAGEATTRLDPKEYAIAPEATSLRLYQVAGAILRNGTHKHLQRLQQLMNED